ncbi:MAG: hypothetical protein ABL925_17315, partial [Methylococcales bacterium]
FAYGYDSLSKSILNVPSFFDFSPYLWMVFISVAVPHVQLLRFGSLKYGKLRGDLLLNIFGHKVLLPIGSALVFYLLWLGISEAILFIYYSLT